VRLFGRSVSRHESPVVPEDEKTREKRSQKPWLAYLQGGPGGACPPPQTMPLTNIALDHGYQVLYLDQRGTGLSSPVTADTLALQGDAQKQADYLKHFRADSIVKDFEAVRQTLTKDYPTELKKWSLFGQSFGGFCSFTYLSHFPASLREVFTTGGVPPLKKPIDEVYKATFATVARRNESYYAKFPEDVEHIQKLATYIQGVGGVKLPAGGTLTVPRFLTIGLQFGAHGGIDNVHDVVLRMRSELDNLGFFSRPTLSAVEAATSFDDAVIYAVLHEVIYCENGDTAGWSAERVGKTLKDFGWLNGIPHGKPLLGGPPLYFSGEMIYPFMFDTSTELGKLEEVANILAHSSDWPDLYDMEQLAANHVPVYAASFVDDMYVDFQLVQDSLSKVKGVKQYITNTMYHDAVRSKSEELLRALFALRDDVMD
jgi:pimeloyl-ACP methyl ester carboxylesterase